MDRGTQLAQGGIMSQKDDLKNLIIKHNRRLLKLKEQIAISGASVDPKIQIEAEDIETEIENLQAQLAMLEGDNRSPRKGEPPMSQGQGSVQQGDQITIGTISKSTTFAVGSGSTVTVNQSQESPDAKITDPFQAICRQIELRSADENVDKTELAQVVQKIAAEAALGEQANPNKVERWLRSLGRMAPDIFEATATCLSTLAEASPEIRRAAEKTGFQ
jgi:hypothetical protein